MTQYTYRYLSLLFLLSFKLTFSTICRLLVAAFDRCVVFLTVSDGIDLFVRLRLSCLLACSTMTSALESGFSSMLLLGALRIGVGVASWAAPDFSSRLFGLGDMAKDHRSELMTRLFAVRDLPSATS